MIKIVLAGNGPYKHYVETAKKYAEALGYETIVYDLGGLDFGIPFEGIVRDEANAKIPCKPNIIEKSLEHINMGDIAVWLDSDAIIYERIDEIETDPFHVGVTVRKPKTTEHQLPVNAGVVFIRKSLKSIEFLTKWKDLANQGVSDQPPLNQLSDVTSEFIGQIVTRDGVRIKVFPCEIYNNFYFSKKEQPLAKIKHYKSKIRHLFPFNQGIVYEEYLDRDGVKKKRSDKLKKPGSLKSKPPRFKKVKERKVKERKVKPIKERTPKVKILKQKVLKEKVLKEKQPSTRKLLKKPQPVQRSKVRFTMSKKKSEEKKENYIYESTDGGKTVYRRPIQTLNRELVSKQDSDGLFRYAEFVEIVDISHKNPVIKKALDNLFLLYYTVRNERKDTP